MSQIRQKQEWLNERLQQTFPHERLLWTRASGCRGCWVVVKQASFGSWLAVRGGNAFRVTPNDTLWLVLLWCSPAAMCPSCYTELSLSLIMSQWDLLSQLFLINSKEVTLRRDWIGMEAHFHHIRKNNVSLNHNYEIKKTSKDIEVIIMRKMSQFMR